MNKDINITEIELKWQSKWEDEKLHVADKNNSSNKKY